MMMVAVRFIEFLDIEQFRELIKMEHRVVLAVLAKESDVLTQVHVLEVIGNKTAVAALYTLAEFFNYAVISSHSRFT